MFIPTRVRIYPNCGQRQALEKQFGCARFVYNEALAESQRIYRETGKGLSYESMALRLPELKSRYDWLGDAVAQVLQQSVRNLSRAFINFFERRGKYPRFKKKGGHQSIIFPQNVKVVGDRIKLPKIGMVKSVIHRELVGIMKRVSVIKTPCGHYYATILMDDGRENPPISLDGPVVGIDVGLIDFAVTSNGQHFANPRFLRKAEKNLRRKQKKLSRKKKGSKSKDKARLLVARAHERVANSRKDFLHKTSRKLVNESQVIAVEDLCVKAMVRNPNLGKSISDVGWGTLSRFLKYKAERDGKLFVRVGRFFPSSKTCNGCGLVRDGMDLSVRFWVCEGCGARHDRDENAARNIRDEANRMVMAGVIPVTASGTGAAASGGCVSRRRGRKPSVTQRP